MLLPLVRRFARPGGDVTPSECATPAPPSPSSDGALSVRPSHADGCSMEPEPCEGGSPRLNLPGAAGAVLPARCQGWCICAAAPFVNVNDEAKKARRSSDQTAALLLCRVHHSSHTTWLAIGGKAQQLCAASGNAVRCNN